MPAKCFKTLSEGLQTEGPEAPDEWGSAVSRGGRLQTWPQEAHGPGTELLSPAK